MEPRDRGFWATPPTLDPRAGPRLARPELAFCALGLGRRRHAPISRVNGPTTLAVVESVLDSSRRCGLALVEVVVIRYGGVATIPSRPVGRRLVHHNRFRRGGRCGCGWMPRFQRLHRINGEFRLGQGLPGCPASSSTPLLGYSFGSASSVVRRSIRSGCECRLGRIFFRKLRAKGDAGWQS